MTKFASLVLYETNRDAYDAGREESGFMRTMQFHEAVGLPVNHHPRMPTVSERILRAKLLLEETFETIEKGLGISCRLNMAGGKVIPFTADDIVVHHEEGRFYDPVETLDGLADVKVVANGTAVQFGLPMEAADFEVFCSNMTKLDEDGNPIHNHCTLADVHPHHDCRELGSCVLLDSSQPIGKVLKPDTYTPANIKGLLEGES